MRLSNLDAIAFLTGKNSLLDAHLNGVQIREIDGEVVVEYAFSARPGADYQRVTLGFQAVASFDFYYTKDYVFGNVEVIKLCSTEDSLYYLSLDPDPADPYPSPKDQDCVVGQSCWAVFDGAP